jgi:methylmalonyl-CoA/ethylmalonyl-CoA epimerase
MLTNVDHIGIAVDDLEKTVAVYRDAFDLGEPHYEEVPEQKVRVAVFPVGETRIELLCPTADDGPIALFLKKRGPGLHHIACRVDDVARCIERLTTAGVRMIDESARAGAEGASIAFVHPKSTGGVLLELVSQSDER